VARGGFEMDIKWKNGAIEKVVIRSRNGGVCRLRSQSPLSGNGLTIAIGENPNALFALAETQKPLINSNAKINSVDLIKTYLYDLKTEKGKEYSILSK
jgi:alpha-L-fucosidase 2